MLPLLNLGAPPEWDEATLDLSGTPLGRNPDLVDATARRHR